MNTKEITQVEQLLLDLSRITSDTVGKAERGQYVINAIERYSRYILDQSERPEYDINDAWVDCAQRCLAAIKGAR
jgi:hypothetical protein